MSRQVVGSSTYFLVDGDIKYLLSGIFAAAPLQLTTSTEMLKKCGEVVLYLHSLLSFAKMTQKLLAFVALPLSVGNTLKYTMGFPLVSLEDTHRSGSETSWLLFRTTQLCSSWGTAFSGTRTNTEQLKDSPEANTTAAEHNLVLAFQEQQNCLRLCANYRLLLSSIVLVYIARHHPINQRGEECLIFDARKHQL